jgi:alpha-glucosidase (family GH31 glycosyl hydrolase)
LGGQIEVYFFMSATAKEVVQRYHSVFGKPQLPPFWALGWQEASQTAYDVTHERDNQLNLIRTVERYQNLSLPLEAVYLDQKQMNKKRNFFLDEELITNITGLRFVLDIERIKLIAYVDAAVYAPDKLEGVEPENPAYNDGNIVNAFIKSTHLPNDTYSNNLVGLRGLKKCVYIDWFNMDKTSTYWYQQLEQYYSRVPFDGLWTTNNDAYNEAQGELNLRPPTKAR